MDIWNSYDSKVQAVLKKKQRTRQTNYRKDFMRSKVNPISSFFVGSNPWRTDVLETKQSMTKKFQNQLIPGQWRFGNQV